MPHAFCLLPHELSVISTPPCLLAEVLYESQDLCRVGCTVIFKQPSQALRELEQEQIGPSLDEGTCKGRGRAGRGAAGVHPHRSWSPREGSELAINKVLEHTQSGPFVGCPEGALSCSSRILQRVPRITERMGVEVRRGSSADRDEVETEGK